MEFLTNSGIGGNPTILSPWLQIVERQLVSVLRDFFRVGQTLVGRGGYRYVKMIYMTVPALKAWAARGVNCLS